MNKSFGLLFYLKRSKMNAEGLTPVYLRITIDGARVEVSSKRYVNPAQWNTSRAKLNGTSEGVRTINTYLKTLEHEVYEVHRVMIERKLPLSATNLKNLLLGKAEAAHARMLIPIFEEHNRQIKILI